MLVIDDKGIIKALEIFTIMSQEGYVNSKKDFIVKGWSPDHIATFIVKKNPQFVATGKILFRSFDGKYIPRHYWKASKIMKFYTKEEMFVFENEYAPYFVELRPGLPPALPLPDDDSEWVTVNVQKLRIKMEKEGLAKNWKYPRVTEKYVRFNGKTFGEGPYHKTSTLYQILSIAWRVSKKARIVVSEGRTYIETSSKKTSYFVATSNFLSIEQNNF